MSASDDARQVLARQFCGTSGSYCHIHGQQADSVLDAVMPDCRTIAQHLDEVDRLRADNATLRGLLAKALPWIDPNDTHDDYLLTVAIHEALGEGS